MHQTIDTYIISAPKDEWSFDEGELDSFSVREPISPVAWAEENMLLVAGAGYATTGKLVLFPWQREALNAIAEYDRVIYCGAVQTGKSLIAECALWYVVDNIPMHTMCCYAKRQTVEDVFQDRIKPTIEAVPFLRRLWDGNPDNLTKDKIKLRNSIIRVASAQVKNDIATFSAGLIYASEVCKYRELDYDVIKLLRGRQEAYGMIGRKKEILESSPIEENDTLHKEMFTSGVINLEPYFPCPTCNTYQVLTLDQIKEVPNAQKEKDHNPERIRQDEAAYYECIYCGNSIQEHHRIDIGERVVWAAKDEKIKPDGTLATPRRKTSGVSFQWSRLVDYSFKYSECLARFFEASRAGSPVKLRSFLNEDMGQYSTIKAEERSTSWLLTKCAKYTMRDDLIPKDVLVIICGVDTQDNGFYYVLRGFGAGKESWLLDCDFIACDMQKDQAPQIVLDTVEKYIHRRELFTVDGRRLFINIGLIDRGGHKANFVDYIAARMDSFYAYIGSKEKLHPLVKAGKEDIYWGNTENLGKIVASDADKDNWHLPEDVPQDYLNQFVKQYEREEVDRYGNTLKKWVKGGADHYRDCENMIQAGLIVLGVDEVLFDGEKVEEAKRDQARPEIEEQPQQQNNYFSDIQSRWQKRGF